MLELTRYEESFFQSWNDFVNVARNGTFLHNRKFMEYHSDRFPDASYVVRKKGKIEALIPGTIRDEVFCSHLGLTYGGVVIDRDISMVDVLRIFELLNFDLTHRGVKRVRFKPVPSIYHQFPAEEDLYALFRNG